MKAHPAVLYYLFLVMFCVTPLLSGCSHYYSPYSGHIPSSAAKHCNRGVAYGEKGQYDLAIKECQEAIRLKPDFAGAHSNLGLAYYNKGQYDLAIKEYQEAIRLKPDLAEAHGTLAAAYKGQGRYDLAIRHAEQTLALRNKPLQWLIRPYPKETRELLDELYRLRGR